MDETETISPSPEAFSIGAKARMAANWPRQLTANMRSISASSSASRSACGTGLVNPAALTSTCSASPQRARTSSRRASREAVSATSAGNAMWPEPGRHSASEAASPGRAGGVGDDDARAGFGETRAVAAPMPPEPPTTSASRPSRELRHDHVSYLIGGMGRLASPGRMTKL